MLECLCLVAKAKENLCQFYSKISCTKEEKKKNKMAFLFFFYTTLQFSSELQTKVGYYK